jgi:hypothetical protein
METKSLVAAGALMLGFWGVLSAWTLTGLVSMTIPGAPPAERPVIEQPEEIVVTACAAAPQELASMACQEGMDDTSENEQCAEL